jgi:protein CpxP
MKRTTAFGVTTRAAILALCTMTMGSVSMMAQDSPAAAPTQQDQAGAPDGGGRGYRGGDQTEFLTKKLNLSSEQATQVKAINDDARQQSMAVRNDSSIAKADKRGKMMDIHKAAQDKIRAVLTDEQKTKYDAMQAKRQERRAEHQGGEQGGAAPAPQQ